MRVAITFDVESDFGLDRSWNSIDAGLPAVARLLRKERVKSTFFVTGRTLEKKADSVLASCKGHEIASHGYAHRELDRLPASGVRSEISKSVKAFAERGLEPDGFRAPRFCMNGRVMKAVAEEFSYDSSIVPSFYSPRFHPFSPRSPYRTGTGGLVELPIGTTDALRIPATSSFYFLLGGLHLRLMELGVPDGFVFVFHSGDFCAQEAPADLPWHKREMYYSRCGKRRISTLAELIRFFRGKRAEFVTCSEMRERLQR